MSILKFLKPNWKIICIFIPVLVIVWLVDGTLVSMKYADYWPYGFPITYYKTWGPCSINDVCYSLSWLALIIDILFWYLVSCGVAALFGKKHTQVS